MGKREKARQAKRQSRPGTGPFDVALTVVPALLLVGLRTFAGPCVHEDGSAAGCTMAGRVLTGIAIVTILLACMRLLGADRRTKRSFDLLLCIAGVLAAALPGTALPLCQMATMNCRLVMLPFARIMGVVTAVLAFVCELTVDREEPTRRRRR